MEAAPIKIEAQLYTGRSLIFRVGPRVKLNQVFNHIEDVCAPDPGHMLVYYAGGLKLDGDQRVANAGLVSGSVIHCHHEPVSEVAAPTSSEAGEAGLAHFEIKEALAHMSVLDIYGHPTLHSAAYRGHEKAVVVLLRRGVSPAGRDGNGCTPLMLAAAQGHLPVGRLLLESMAGQGVDAIDHMGRTALYYAAGVGRYEMVDCLLRNGAQESLGDHKGITALTVAGASGHVTVVGRLVEHVGSEGLKATDEAGRTALHHAAGLGQEGVVGLLLASGVESDREDGDRMTALALAASRGHVGVVRMLVLHMAQRGVEAAPDKLADALQHAAYRGHASVVALLMDQELAGLGVSEDARRTAMICAAVGGHFPIMQMLLESLHGPDSNTRIEDNVAVLQWAAVAGHAKAIAMLRQKGVTFAASRTPFLQACYKGLVLLVQVLTLGKGRQWLSARDCKGMTGLHAAAMEGHGDVVALLLRRGASTQSKDNKGRTPLMHAIKARHTGPAKQILGQMETGLEEGDKEDHTALHYAAAFGQEELAILLLERGAAAASRDTDGMTPFMLAAYNGHLQLVELLAPHCSEGLGLEARDKAGMTALYHAAAEGHEEVVALLLRRGASTQSKDDQGRTPLMHAIEARHTGPAKQILEHMQTGLEEGDKNGHTALHYAASFGQEELAILLLERGASAASRDAEGLTPLMLAAEDGHLQLVELLASHCSEGLGLEARDKAGMTALYHAAAEGHEEVVALLLRRGASTQSKDDQGRTPLMHAIEARHTGPAKQILEHMQTGLEEGDKEDHTALHYAASFGQEELAILLLERGASAASRDADGMTPFMLAACNGHLRLVELLAPHCSEDLGLEARDKAGCTALFLAAAWGHEEVVAFLKGLQARCDTMNDEGITAVMRAANWGHVGVVHILLQDLPLGAVHQSDLCGRTAMHWAAIGGSGEIITYLMSKGASATTHSARAMTPLMMAAIRGHISVVQLLFERVHQVNLEEADEGGLTALHMAAFWGHPETVAFLLSKQAEPNARNVEGTTPLVLAARQGHAAVARLLAQHLGRQRVDETDAEGRTALFWAAYEGHEETVDVLLSSGADPYIKTPDLSVTPLMAASFHSHVSAVQTLLQHMGGRGLGERQAQGATALFLACQTYRPGRSEEVVRLLFFAGADHTVKDNIGRTPRALAEMWEGGKGKALFEWWEGELERVYLLCKARAISEDIRQQQTAPSAPLSAYLQARVATGSAPPTVEVLGGQKRKQEEGERHAVVAFAATTLGSDLFTELMHGFQHRGTSEMEAGLETGEAQ